MLIKLGDENKLLGGLIEKKTVKSMVADYRKKPADKLFYAHFELEEVLQLFIDNGALSAGALGHIIPNHGMKIYLGQHNHVDNCPSGRERDYMGKNTAIVCTTYLTDATKFRYSDKLEDRKDSIIISGTRLTTGGDALDQSSTYPPDNPYDQGNPPVPVPIPPGKDPDTFDVGL